MAALDILTSLSVLLIIGIILTYISARLKLSNVLALIIAGIVLGPITFNGVKIFDFSSIFLEAVAIIALIMIVFDSSSRLPVRSISRDTIMAFKITGLFILAELIVFSIAAKYVAGFSWFLAILFSSLLVGTDPSAVLAILQDIKKHPVITLLQVEAIVNTPMTVILPFIVIDLAKTFNLSTLISTFIEQISPFLQQLVTGIGAGIFIALIITRVLKHKYSEVLSPVTFIASALLTYILATKLGGNGVLAVTTLGLYFGSAYIQKKDTLKTFGSLLSNLFEILVFLLLGISMTFNTDWQFYVKSLALFLVYILIRTAVMMVVFHQSKTSFREKLFLGMNSSKGVAVGAVSFSLLSLGITDAMPVIEYSLMFMIFSILLSTILARFYASFLTLPK